MCSIVSGTISTFDNKPIQVANYTRPNCSVLMVADCSAASRFALFVIPSSQSSSDNNNENTYSLEIHIDDHVIWYSPRKDGTDFIRLKNLTEIQVSNLVQPLGDGVDLR